MQLCRATPKQGLSGTRTPAQSRPPSAASSAAAQDSRINENEVPLGFRVFQRPFDYHASHGILKNYVLRDSSHKEQQYNNVIGFERQRHMLVLFDSC